MSHDEAEADVMTGQITVGEVLVWLIITSIPFGLLLTIEDMIKGE
jgi:hypothetical protein